MKIAVNTRLLLPGKLDGIGWFSYHVLQRMTARHPETEFIFLFDRPWSQEFVFNSNVTPVSLFPQARHPFLYYLWFEFSIPAALKKYQPDLFFSPDGYLSLSAIVPQVSVIHDLNFEHYPGDLPYLTRKYYRYFFPRFAAAAQRIATVSAYSKRDMVSCYGTDPEKIDVVFNGVNEMYAPVDEAVKISVRNKYTRGAPYFLFVGMLHQRKNIANLFRAFELFKSKNPGNMKLLIVGHKKWWTDEMENVFNQMRFKDDVIFSGRVPIEELVKITASAMAMTYISYFEGFGVPIIESMRCGVPVITSNVTSMPEVGGNAAMLVDPFNVNDIANSMDSVYNDEKLRNRLSLAGLERSGDFSWDRTADKMWDCLNKAVQ